METTQTTVTRFYSNYLAGNLAGAVLAILFNLVYKTTAPVWETNGIFWSMYVLLSIIFLMGCYWFGRMMIRNTVPPGSHALVEEQNYHGNYVAAVSTTLTIFLITAFSYWMKQSWWHWGVVLLIGVVSFFVIAWLYLLTLPKEK